MRLAEHFPSLTFLPQNGLLETVHTLLTPFCTLSSHLTFLPQNGLLETIHTFLTPFHTFLTPDPPASDRPAGDGVLPVVPPADGQLQLCTADRPAQPGTVWPECKGGESWGQALGEREGKSGWLAVGRWRLGVTWLWGARMVHSYSACRLVVTSAVQATPMMGNAQACKGHGRAERHAQCTVRGFSL